MGCFLPWHMVYSMRERQLTFHHLMIPQDYMHGMDSWKDMLLLMEKHATDKTHNSIRLISIILLLAQIPMQSYKASVDCQPASSRHIPFRSISLLFIRYNTPMPCNLQRDHVAPYLPCDFVTLLRLIKKMSSKKGFTEDIL